MVILLPFFADNILCNNFRNLKYYLSIPQGMPCFLVCSEVTLLLLKNHVVHTKFRAKCFFSYNKLCLYHFKIFEIFQSPNVFLVQIQLTLIGTFWITFLCAQKITLYDKWHNILHYLVDNYLTITIFLLGFPH